MLALRIAEARTAGRSASGTSGRVRGNQGRGRYRIDLLADDQIIVELKAVEAIHPIHKAQLLSYLRLSGKKLGLIINFHVRHLKDGITRMVNGL
jgi:GxxExxY protein